MPRKPENTLKISFLLKEKGYKKNFRTFAALRRPFIPAVGNGGQTLAKASD